MSNRRNKSLSNRIEFQIENASQKRDRITLISRRFFNIKLESNVIRKETERVIYLIKRKKVKAVEKQLLPIRRSRHITTAFAKAKNQH